MPNWRRGRGSPAAGAAGASAARADDESSAGPAAIATGSVRVDLRKLRREAENEFLLILFIMDGQLRDTVAPARKVCKWNCAHGVKGHK